MNNIEVIFSNDIDDYTAGTSSSTLEDPEIIVPVQSSKIQKKSK